MSTASHSELAKRVLDYLERLPGYPFDETIDTAFVQELIDDCPDLDLLEQLKTFRWYYADAPISSIRKPRAAIRRWMANARSHDRW